ncbi:archaemetzincin family Zn-dependent metalloprotease [Syntrophorhabdus aromaticivorans]|uniref:archaemetzincin family Zn-dependent metalloprotease n=1 Tax=Syntrophorhabdus aromaticivorans TaxID=328301 RepID=UPI000686EDBD|nr:archaemetzincin family Zn-dependent metalloprotease [Syntrophorhabdus aromaticivorans]
MKRTISIVPVGRIDSNVLHGLQQGLSVAFSVAPDIAEPLPEPFYAFNSRRNQYSAESILEVIASRLQGDTAEKILGIVDHDLYVPELNFVFGVALGRATLISIARLRQEFYGLSSDDDLFCRRVLTEAVHELGHSYGLKHCVNPNCVMFFSRTLLDTDKKGSDFCAPCNIKMHRFQSATSSPEGQKWMLPSSLSLSFVP